jgi:glycerophosphoryl diester phosphodiesterase
MMLLASRIYIVLLFITSFFPVQSFCQTQAAHIKVAGHRGGYYYKHPESSLPLFASIAKKFKGDTVIVEVDLRKSKDGTIYIMHDEMVDRTTNGRGKIDQLEDAYLNQLFLKKKNGEITRERIPTFNDLLIFIKERNINLMLDIKVPIHEEAYDLVKKHTITNRMVTLTFNMDLTEKVAILFNQISLSALIESEDDWQKFKAVPMVPVKKIAYINTKTPASLIQELKKNQIKLMTDMSEDIRNSGKPLDAAGYIDKAKEYSLDILITDFPIEARKALKRNTANTF